MTIIRKDRGRYHIYEVDGRRLPGVTTITNATSNKDNLVNWAAEETARYAQDHWDFLSGLPLSERYETLTKARYLKTDAAKDRGTEVHRLAEQLNHDETVWIPEQLAGHVNAYADFLDRMEPKTVATELWIANAQVGYCGTLDLIADMDGERWLLDLKTSRSGIFLETALQVCAYAHAATYAREDGEEHPMADLGIARGGAIHVRADGTWELRPVDIGDGPWDYFRHCVALYEAADAAKEWVARPSEPASPYRRYEIGEAW